MSAAVDTLSTFERMPAALRPAVHAPTVRALPDTSPAPLMAGSPTDIPSARPTSVPDFDVSILAEATALRYPSTRGMPMDLSVPVRLLREDYEGEGICHRAAFILLHVDGVSSIDEIACSAGLPIREVIETLFGLVSAGMVRLDGQATNEQSCPQSGVQRRPMFAELGFEQT